MALYALLPEVGFYIEIALREPIKTRFALNGQANTLCCDAVPEATQDQQ
jgi:hypothetical protein